MESGVSSNELHRHDQIDVPACHCASWYHQYAAAPSIAALTAATRTSGPNVPSSQCRGPVRCVQVNRNAPLSNSRATHGTPANRPVRTGRARTATAMRFGVWLGLLNEAQAALLTHQLPPVVAFATRQPPR